MIELPFNSETDVRYEQLDYTVAESDGNVTLCVEVIEPPNREHKPPGTLLSFNLSISLVSGGTAGTYMFALPSPQFNHKILHALPIFSACAVAGVDYSEDIDEVLSFNTGDTRQCYTINITADEECEFVDCESEFFLSQVQSSNPRVNLVSSVARVFIDDLMELNCSTYTSSTFYTILHIVLTGT